MRSRVGSEFQLGLHELKLRFPCAARRAHVISTFPPSRGILSHLERKHVFVIPSGIITGGLFIISHCEPRVERVAFAVTWCTKSGCLVARNSSGVQVQTVLTTLFTICAPEAIRSVASPARRARTCQYRKYGTIFYPPRRLRTRTNKRANTHFSTFSGPTCFICNLSGLHTDRIVIPAPQSCRYFRANNVSDTRYSIQSRL